GGHAGRDCGRRAPSSRDDRHGGPGPGPRRRRRRVHRAGGAAAAGAARPLLPDARVGPRRRRRAAGRAGARLARTRPLRGPQLAALLALHRRHQLLPGRRRPTGPAGAAGGPRPGQRPRGARRHPRHRGRLARPLPRPARPGRAPRGRRAGVRGSAAAPAGQPARGPAAVRGARLLRRGDRGAHADLAGVGEQRAAAGPQARRRARARPLGGAGRPGGGRRPHPRARLRLLRRAGPRRRGRPGGAAHLRRDLVDAAVGALVPGPGRRAGVRRGRAAGRLRALAAPGGVGQRAARRGVLAAAGRRTAAHGLVHRRAHRARRPDRGDHLVHRPRALHGVRPAPRGRL
ncbi:MAG: RNA polymerase sigma factor, partial [uncultured Pseudonocardia sp.]